MKYIIVHINDIIDKYQSIAYTYCSYVLMFVLPVNLNRKDISCFYYHNSLKIRSLLYISMLKVDSLFLVVAGSYLQPPPSVSPWRQVRGDAVGPLAGGVKRVLVG